MTANHFCARYRVTVPFKHHCWSAITADASSTVLRGRRAPGLAPAAKIIRLFYDNRY